MEMTPLIIGDSRNDIFDRLALNIIVGKTLHLVESKPALLEPLGAVQGK
jgi:hypothetical protein